jgi:hypothetical protein
MVGSEGFGYRTWLPENYRTRFAEQNLNSYSKNI